EFGQNRFDMSAGGLRTDEQRGRDLGVTVPGRYEFEHVTFTLGEPVRVRSRLLPTGVRVAPTELREALASSAHRGACTQSTERLERSFHCSDVAAELSQGSVVR